MIRRGTVRRPRKLASDVAVIDDPRVSDRTLSLALRKCGSRVYFEGRTCGGATRCGRRLKSGKRALRCVPCHGPRCPGGRDYWHLLDFKGFANEILGCGVTPEKALADAIDKRSADQRRWREAAR